ncbi:MAG: hypothetical protein RL577_1160 [Bacteroidota bacterium]
MFIIQILLNYQEINGCWIDMARKPFAFKQFTVEQEQVTLAVTTDACLFGASIDLGPAASILDLGTGTGLLLLMLAQRYPQLLGYGLELDPATALQAAANAASSPFHKRLHIAQGDWNQPIWKTVQTTPSSFDDSGKPRETLDFSSWPKRFDALVCNPPFFEGQQESQDPLKRSARHQASGSLEKLLYRASTLLNPSGQLYLLLPPESCPLDWGPWHIASLQPIAAHPEKSPHLLSLTLQLNPASGLKKKVLFTYDQPGTYSLEAKQLLREFYLNL